MFYDPTIQFKDKRPISEYAMKKLTFFIVLLMVFSTVEAQTDSVYIWNKWCARKDTLLLFTAANNTIQVYCRGMKPDDIKLKSLDNSLRISKPEIKGDTMSVLAMPYPDKKGKNNNMRLAVLYKKNSKVIKTVNFSSDNVPALMAHVGKLQGNEALRKDILAQSTLSASFPNSLYSYPYRIKQFVFKITTPNSTATFHVNGIFLTKEIMQEIKDAPAGTIATFTEIKATCPECAVRTLDDIKLKIK